MKRILQALHTVEGVRGSLVFDSNGQILGFQAHAVYDQQLLESVSQTVVSTLDSVQLLHPDWEALNVSFDDGSVIIRNIKPGGAAAGRTILLVVIADSHLNPSFAGVALRVAAAKLKTFLESPNAAAEMSSSSINLAGASTSQTGSHPTGTPGVGATPPPVPAASASSIRAVSDLSSSGLSWSGLGSSGRGTSDVQVADEESSAFLTASAKALSMSVGPMAKVFVKEAVRKICAGRQFSRAQWETLITELRKHIRDNEEAAQFQKDMRARF